MAGIDSYTKLVLHCDGTDATTSFPDSSLSPHTMSVNGNAQVDTAQSVFGGASLLLDGTGDYLSSADSADWALGSGDFTIDFWARFNDKASSAAESFVAQYGASPQKSFVVDYVNASTVLRLVYSTDGSNDTVKSVTWAPSNATWYHIAVVRSSTSLYFFVDGTQVGATQTVSTDSLLNSTSNLTVGAIAAGTNNFNGWLDEIRVSKGIARWTANFTAPTAAYTATDLTPVTEGTLTLTASSSGSLTLTPSGS